MFNRFKNIKLKTLIPQLVITLAYPFIKAFISEKNRLLIFTDTLTIISGLLILIGIFFGLYLHGDFDHTAYTLRRGIGSDKLQKSFDDFQKDKKYDREDAFNYPLWLGILYILVSILISYIWL